MKLLVLLIIGAILYYIARNYKTEKFVNINLNVKEEFKGDLLHHEAGLLVALMAKVAKADGNVCELEAQILKHTFSDISSHFSNHEEIREKLKVIYKNEKESFENTIKLATALYKLSKHDYMKRIKVLEYLLNLAFIDKDFSDAESMIVEDISSALQIKATDFHNMVNKFKEFYASQASNAQTSIEDAYKTLNCVKEDDDTVIKKSYRSLVKKHHPDIIIASGASEDIIAQATTKLQEINDAYEVIKKSRK